jgi:signal transduction histidine kinase
MTSDQVGHSEGLLEAFEDYERKVAIQNYKIGCILGTVFMPAGIVLDYFVYPQYLPYFVEFRLWCSALLAGIWVLLSTRFGERFLRGLGMVEVYLPLLFISGMIYMTDGAHSTYYAGLNLVVMGAGLVLRWTLLESVLVLIMALTLYAAACLAHGAALDGKILFNNLYFLIVTGVFTITGNYFYNRIRFREFALRFQLDRSHQMLEESNRKLRELDEIKSRFFANVSHELRTPLTLLLAPLEALLQQRPRLEAEARDWLETMQSNGLRLLKLINDLLDLVRLESGRMEVNREWLDLSEFVRGLGQSVRQFARDKRVRLDTLAAPDVGTMVVDLGKLEKILLNLLFNALKFTPAGGAVVLRVERTAEEVVFHVTDTGMGIPESQLPFIFDRFWQADTSSQRKYQGVGIGLALVKELVDIQGGRIKVTSHVGRGTHFEVFLPLLSAASPLDRVEPSAEGAAPGVGEPATSASESSATDTAWLAKLYRRAELFPSITSLEASVRPVETSTNDPRPRVLLADDEPDMLRFLKSQLQQQFQVFEAVDGSQAIEKATQFLPDAILCDMMMPERDGLQVCQELRARTPTQNIPIILVTARADEATKIQALEAGASDFLTKPFSCAELHVRLRNLVESHQYQQRLAQQKLALEAALEELKETETQLVQSEKLASLGRLSAGIIHEVNNPLNFMKTGLYTLRKKGNDLPAEKRADFQEVLQDIEEGIDRVKNIVSDLRSFAHPTASMADEVSTQGVVDTALRLLSHDLKTGVRIVQSIPEGHTVAGNRNQLIQVMVNLLQNSIDAMRRKEFVESEPTIWIGAEANGSTQLLRVRDNGSGIPAEAMDKVFDPFFTTKDVGEGMGLGLSICYRIVEQHHGRIRVHSEPGQFCEFTLELPSALT